jgi:hypothetical protein
MLDCLLDHKAQEHFFEVIDAPTLQLYIELLMRNIEKICQLLGIVKPEQMRGTHLRRDTVIPQRFQASKAAPASDGHAVYC